MSGGHFDYNCFRISQFADELQHEIDVNGDTEVDQYGDTLGFNFDENTMDRIRDIQRLIALAGDLAREVEWLYSSDHGEDTFCDVVDEICGQLKYS